MEIKSTILLALFLLSSLPFLHGRVPKDPLMVDPNQDQTSRPESITWSTGLDLKVSHKRPPNALVIQQYLLPHNIVRARIGLPPLRWSKTLADFAANWAHQREKDCELIHSNRDYGENIFWGSGKDWRPSEAVAAWAEEKAYYNYKSNSCDEKRDCLHYTQMVWRQSKRVGCAKVTCTSGDTFITCNYDPHGNVIGEKPF